MISCERAAHRNGRQRRRRRQGWSSALKVGHRRRQRRWLHIMMPSLSSDARICAWRRCEVHRSLADTCWMPARRQGSPKRAERRGGRRLLPFLLASSWSCVARSRKQALAVREEGDNRGKSSRGDVSSKETVAAEITRGSDDGAIEWNGGRGRDGGVSTFSGERLVWMR